MTKLYVQLRLVRKDQCGPPASLGPDDVWAQDDWDARREREARRAVAAQGPPLSAFWVAEYERRSQRNWDVFYKRNGDRAYRDRRYVDAVFPVGTKGTLLELGCGVGNGVAWADFERVVCLDFSKTAVDMLRSRFDFEARVCDIATQDFGESDASADCVSCFFVLSALAPDSLHGVASKIARVLKPGGLVLVRDYGRYDQAQLRFRRGNKLAENWSVSCVKATNVSKVRKERWHALLLLPHERPRRSLCSAALPRSSHLRVSRRDQPSHLANPPSRLCAGHVSTWRVPKLGAFLIVTNRALPARPHQSTWRVPRLGPLTLVRL